MNKKIALPEIKKVKNKCSVCDKYFTTKIFPDKTYKGGIVFIA